jgi:hypothetical protein
VVIGRLFLGVAVMSSVPSIARAQLPATPIAAQDFGSGFVVTGDWLQANALPLGRSTFPSNAASVSWRNTLWTADGGWLRATRELSTVQGGTLGGGAVLRWNRFVFLPSLHAFAGQALASADTTGYDFTTPSGAVGHQPRYDYSSSASFGGGASIAVEVPIYRMVAFRAVVSHWLFSGAPLEGDRQRTLAGAGLSIHTGR